ncbi:hypothetical protein DFH06DRAFT_1360699 [Mycena polygramma]|nr:hypothetical protein DFH06DRAFT_1360699 [Mycena polygramma]
MHAARVAAVSLHLQRAASSVTALEQTGRTTIASTNLDVQKQSTSAQCIPSSLPRWARCSFRRAGLPAEAEVGRALDLVICFPDSASNTLQLATLRTRAPEPSLCLSAAVAHDRLPTLPHTIPDNPMPACASQGGSPSRPRVLAPPTRCVKAKGEKERKIHIKDRHMPSPAARNRRSKDVVFPSRRYPPRCTILSHRARKRRWLSIRRISIDASPSQEEEEERESLFPVYRHGPAGARASCLKSGGASAQTTPYDPFQPAREAACAWLHFLTALVRWDVVHCTVRALEGCIFSDPEMQPERVMQAERARILVPLCPLALARSKAVPHRIGPSARNGHRYPRPHRIPCPPTSCSRVHSPAQRPVGDARRSGDLPQPERQVEGGHFFVCIPGSALTDTERTSVLCGAPLHPPPPHTLVLPAPQPHHTMRASEMEAELARTLSLSTSPSSCRIYLARTPPHQDPQSKARTRRPKPFPQRLCLECAHLARVFTRPKALSCRRQTESVQIQIAPTTPAAIGLSRSTG